MDLQNYLGQQLSPLEIHPKLLQCMLGLPNDHVTTHSQISDFSAVGPWSLNIWNCAGWIFPSLSLLNSTIYPSRPSWSPTPSSKFFHRPSFLRTAPVWCVTNTCQRPVWHRPVLSLNPNAEFLKAGDHMFSSHLPSCHLICRWPHWWYPPNTCWMGKKCLGY